MRGKLGRNEKWKERRRCAKREQQVKGQVQAKREKKVDGIGSLLEKGGWKKGNYQPLTKLNKRVGFVQVRKQRKKIT